MKYSKTSTSCCWEALLNPHSSTHSWKTATIQSRHLGEKPGCNCIWYCPFSSNLDHLWSLVLNLPVLLLYVNLIWGFQDKPAELGKLGRTSVGLWQISSFSPMLLLISRLVTKWVTWSFQAPALELRQTTGRFLCQDFRGLHALFIALLVHFPLSAVKVWDLKHPYLSPWENSSI